MKKYVQDWEQYLQLIINIMIASPYRVIFYYHRLEQYLNTNRMKKLLF
jgi:hypothetical protein